MLSQLNHWIDLAGVAVDALLLLRILQLRLQKTYLFITLVAVLALAFDSTAIWLGVESREFGRVLIYSRFLYAFVYPAAAFDVWEEVKQHMGRVRKFAVLRLGVSLTLAALFGLLISAVAGGDEVSGEAVLDTFAVILWAAASTASLAFLWSLQRAARAQKVALTRNTSVWLVYFELLLAAEALNCFLLIVGQQFSDVVRDSLELALNLFYLVITLWCVWRLRRPATSDVPSAPENASL